MPGISGMKLVIFASLLTLAVFASSSSSSTYEYENDLENWKEKLTIEELLRFRLNYERFDMVFDNDLTWSTKSEDLEIQLVIISESGLQPRKRTTIQSFLECARSVSELFSQFLEIIPVEYFEAGRLHTIFSTT